MKYRALLALVMGEDKLAKKQARQLYNFSRKQYGEESVYTMDACDVMISCYGKEKDRRGKVKDLLAGQVMRGNSFEEGHPYLLHMSNQSLSWLLFQEQEKQFPMVRETTVKGAIELLSQCRSAFGERHEETYTAFSNAGWAAMLSGEAEKALFYFEKCQQAMGEVYDISHPKVIVLLLDIARCHELLGDDIAKSACLTQAYRRRAYTEYERLEELISRSTEQLQDMWEFRKELEEKKRQEEEKQEEEEKQQEEEERNRQREAASLQYKEKLKEQKKQEQKKQEQIQKEQEPEEQEEERDLGVAK